MAADKKTKIAKLAKRMAPEFREPLKELLHERKIIDPKEFARLTGLMVDSFDETLAEQPNEKRMERKLRDLILGILNIQYEGEIEDEVLRRATKIIRERVVRDSEREKLARFLGDEVRQNWLAMDDETIEHIGGFDGLLERLQDKVEGDLDYSDGEFLDLMLEVGHLICANYMEKLDEATFDELMDRCIAVCGLLEAGENFGDPLLELVKFGMQHLGFIALMRRAFSGLLLSDLIVRQIGKGLGIKEKISVTDFIIFVGVKVAEKEHLEKVEKTEVARVKKIFEEVRGM